MAVLSANNHRNFQNHKRWTVHDLFYISIASPNKFAEWTKQELEVFDPAIG
jgi:hypothetical protein